VTWFPDVARRSVRLGPALVAAAVLAASWGAAARQGDPAGDATELAPSPPAGLAAPVVDDIVEAFSRLDARGEPMTAAVNGLIPAPWYQASFRNWFGFRNHFQGIQRVPGSDFLVMSGSNIHEPMGRLLVIRMEGESAYAVASVPVDAVLWHAGGLGMFGSVLAVPTFGDSPLRSKVVFYDMIRPEEPRRLPIEIERPGEKAYAAALTRMPNGRYLTAVLADRDGIPRRIDFYLSRSSDLTDGFNPEAVRWFTSEVVARDGQDRNFGDFQSVNFVRQADGRLYLVGFHNTVPSMPFIPGRDYADLYEVVMPDEMAKADVPVLARPSLVKTASTRMYCKDGYCNMDAAAGLYVDPESRAIEVYAATGWIDNDEIKYTVYRQR